MLDREASSLAGWARQSFTLIEEACRVQFFFFFFFWGQKLDDHVFGFLGHELISFY